MNFGPGPEALLNVELRRLRGDIVSSGLGGKGKLSQCSRPPGSSLWGVDASPRPVSMPVFCYLDSW